jgi:hypothetical protein
MPKNRLAHAVYFTLNDRSPAARQKLIDGCKKYLTGHPGTVFFACGTLCQDLNRDVNDRGFDVALHLVFDSLASHDAYQKAPRHNEFVAACQTLWQKVRVFDSLVES